MERKRDRETMVESSSGSSNAMEKDRAAASMSVMPFSCIICFEEFCSVERPPMVLPCGHTYVCLPCTKRLKKCMECRQPLFLPAPTPTPPTTNPSFQKNNYLNPQQLQQQIALERRYGPSGLSNNENSTNAQQQQQLPPPTPLPIPKNLVLLSMMEAAERQSRVSRIRLSSSSPLEASSSSPPPVPEEEDGVEFDFNKIVTGMAALTGPCGTYAVRERNGLLVVAQDPRTQNNIDSSDIEIPVLVEGEEEPTTTTTTAPQPATERRDENAMDVEEEQEEDHESTSASADEEFDLKKHTSIQDVQRDVNEPIEEEEKDKEESFIIQSRLSFELAPRPQKELPEQHEQPQPQQPQELSSSTLLEYGQTVQVVSFYDGVAKLARDKGYIAASPRQLVKVGEPLDESCRLQGLLDTVSCRGKGLEKTLDENRLIAEALQRQLDTAVEMEPNHPIISFKNSGENRAPTVGATSPRTPNGPAYSPPLSALQTPKKTYSFEPLTPTQHRAGSFDLNNNNHHHHHGSSSCRISPAPRTPEFDADGIRIGFAAAPTMPRYHADRGSMDEQEFGCGSSFMGAGGAELFGEGFAGSHDLSDDDYDGNHHHQHHHRDQHHHHTTSHARTSGGGGGGGGGGVPSLNPSLSASFDVVDFRTGMSCHRALNASKFGRSPKPAPRRQVRTMGDHRGIAPIRSTSSSSRLQPNNVSLLPTYSTPNGEEVSWYKE